MSWDESRMSGTKDGYLYGQKVQMILGSFWMVPEPKDFSTKGKTFIPCT